GLEHWFEKGQPVEGVHLTFSLKQGNQLVTMLGRLSKAGIGVDLRLQSAVWMEELVQKGVKVEIEDVSLARLDEISSQNDLTIVAAGRGELKKLFVRDNERSTYTTPQRLLAMVCVDNVSTRVPYASYFSAVKFNFFAPFGEAFWMPW